jgi:coenzyme F420-0:L-glutamate ligase/coenzyme F420-1:gamma-L-glutamate ligase
LFTRPVPVVLIPIDLPVVHVGQDLLSIVSQSLRKQKVNLKNGDILAVASKVISVCEGQVVNLDCLRVSKSAEKLARKMRMNNQLAALVIGEADRIFGGVNGFLLTLKNSILTANAGVDLKNSPPGTATIWPERPDRSANILRKGLEHKYRIKIGVEIVDSRVTPLRLGTIGLAIGVSGFNPIVDERGKPDLYGRRIRVTQINVADDLAAAAHTLMGEVRERVGAVIIRNAPVTMGESGSETAKLAFARCLVSSGLRVR